MVKFQGTSVSYFIVHSFFGFSFLWYGLFMVGIVSWLGIDMIVSWLWCILEVWPIFAIMNGRCTCMTRSLHGIFRMTVAIRRVLGDFENVCVTIGTRMSPGSSTNQRVFSRNSFLQENGSTLSLASGAIRSRSFTYLTPDTFPSSLRSISDVHLREQASQTEITFDQWRHIFVENQSFAKLHAFPLLEQSDPQIFGEEGVSFDSSYEVIVPYGDRRPVEKAASCRNSICVKMIDVKDEWVQRKASKSTSNAPFPMERRRLRSNEILRNNSIQNVLDSMVIRSNSEIHLWELKRGRACTMRYFSLTTLMCLGLLGLLKQPRTLKWSGSHMKEH